MAQRGRKPAALKVLPFVPGSGRPLPPGELDAVEAKYWRAVIDALPPFWVDPAGEIVLRRLCAQAAILERQEARLRALREQGEDSGPEAAKLTTAHGATAKAVAILMRELRATPLARFTARASAPVVADAPKQLRPWEIRGGKAG